MRPSQSRQGQEAGQKGDNDMTSSHLSGFKLEAPFDQLKGILRDGVTPDEVMAAIPDNSGNLVKLLWLLENIGLLMVEGQPPQPLVEQRLTLAMEGRADQTEESSERLEKDSNIESARARRRRAKAAKRLAGRVPRKATVQKIAGSRSTKGTIDRHKPTTTNSWAFDPMIPRKRLRELVSDSQ